MSLSSSDGGGIFTKRYLYQSRNRKVEGLTDEKSPVRSRDHHHTLVVPTLTADTGRAPRTGTTLTTRWCATQMTATGIGNIRTTTPVCAAYRTELDTFFSILFYEFEMTFMQSASAVKNRLSTRLHKAFLALNPSTCRSIPK